MRFNGTNDLLMPSGVFNGFRGGGFFRVQYFSGDVPDLKAMILAIEAQSPDTYRWNAYSVLKPYEGLSTYMLNSGAATNRVTINNAEYNEDGITVPTMWRDTNLVKFTDLAPTWYIAYESIDSAVSNNPIKKDMAGLTTCCQFFLGECNADGSMLQVLPDASNNIIYPYDFYFRLANKGA